MVDQSSHASESQQPAEPGGYSSRCPRCFHLLEGLATQGECPECGTHFDSDSRFAYARTGGLGTTIVRWTWPLLTTIAAIALTPVAIVVVALVAQTVLVVGVASFLNGTVQAFQAIRRWRLQRDTVTDFTPTLGMCAQSLACGFAVSVLSSLIILGLMRVLPGG